MWLVLIRFYYSARVLWLHCFRLLPRKHVILVFFFETLFTMQGFRRYSGHKISEDRDVQAAYESLTLAATLKFYQRLESDSVKALVGDIPAVLQGVRRSTYETKRRKIQAGLRRASLFSSESQQKKG